MLRIPMLPGLLILMYTCKIVMRRHLFPDLSVSFSQPRHAESSCTSDTTVLCLLVYLEMAPTRFEPNYQDPDSQIRGSDLLVVADVETHMMFMSGSLGGGKAADPFEFHVTGRRTGLVLILRNRRDGSTGHFQELHMRERVREDNLSSGELTGYAHGLYRSQGCYKATLLSYMQYRQNRSFWGY